MRTSGAGIVQGMGQRGQVPAEAIFQGAHPGSLSKRSEGAVGQRAHRCRPHAQRLGDLLVGEVGEIAEHDNQTLAVGETVQRAAQVDELLRYLTIGDLDADGPVTLLERPAAKDPGASVDYRGPQMCVRSIQLGPPLIHGRERALNDLFDKRGRTD